MTRLQFITTLLLAIPGVKWLVRKQESMKISWTRGNGHSVDVIKFPGDQESHVLRLSFKTNGEHKVYLDGELKASWTDNKS